VQHLLSHCDASVQNIKMLVVHDVIWPIGRAVVTSGGSKLTLRVTGGWVTPKDTAVTCSVSSVAIDRYEQILAKSI
jgi:hypothetical protein